MKTIEIFLEGGLIQEIIGIPKGTKVIVRDFDAEEFGGDDEDDTSIYGGKLESFKGRECWKTEWTAEES